MEYHFVSLMSTFRRNGKVFDKIVMIIEGIGLINRAPTASCPYGKISHVR